MAASPLPVLVRVRIEARDVADVAGQDHLVGGRRDAPATEDLDDSVLVDRVVDGLPDQLVLHRPGVLVEGEIDVESDVVRTAGRDHQPLVIRADEAREVLRRRSRVPLHLGRSGLELLLNALRRESLRDGDSVDIGFAERVRLRVPGRIALEAELLGRCVLHDLVRAVRDRVLTELGAIRHVLHVLDGSSRGEGQREDVQKVRRRLDQADDERARVLGDNPGQAVGVDVPGNRGSRALDLREAVAVPVHSEDRAREVARRTGRGDRVAEQLELADEVRGGHLTRRGRVPLDARLDAERVRRAVRADAAVRPCRNRCGDIRCKPKRLGEVGRSRIGDQLPREGARDDVQHRVVAARGVEVEDVTRPEEPQCAATLRRCAPRRRAARDERGRQDQRGKPGDCECSDPVLRQRRRASLRAHVPHHVPPGFGAHRTTPRRRWSNRGRRMGTRTAT